MDRNNFRMLALHAAARANADYAMCEKCVEIDRRIIHYSDLSTRLQDPQTSQGIAELIAELEAQKVELHPEKTAE